MNQSKLISKNIWIPFFVEHFNKEFIIYNGNKEYENTYSLIEIPEINDGKLICYSKQLLKTIFNIELIDDQQIEDFICGKINPLKNQNYSQIYSGHQFGEWAGKLGDGRVINFGEIKNGNHYYTIQLKGIGLTPFSRFADGNAVLRSTLREHLCSEAMYYLNIPTTRSFGVIKRKYKVKRDISYNGIILNENASINCRIAQSFIRIGNFQHMIYQQDIKGLEKLLDFVINNYFQQFQNIKDGYILFFEEVVKLSAQLVAKWQSFGFIHGVLNTDNHSILGLTIDYGPFCFMEKFDKNYTANQIGDVEKRYCYNNQPQIILWNLYQLANTLIPVTKKKQILQNILDNYQNIYQSCLKDIFTKKFGFQYLNQQDYNTLYEVCIELLQSEQFDFTLFFSELGRSIVIKKDSSSSILDDKFIEKVSYKDQINEQKVFQFEQLYTKLLDKYDINDTKRKKIMNQINPMYILRNWFLQEIIDQVNNDNYNMLREVEQMIEQPFLENDKFNYYYQKIPKLYNDKLKYNILSCSSQLIFRNFRYQNIFLIFYINNNELKSNIKSKISIIRYQN